MSLVRIQVAPLSQRDRAARWVSFGQKWKMIFCRYIVYLQPLWRNRPAKLSNSVK